MLVFCSRAQGSSGRTGRSLRIEASPFAAAGGTMKGQAKNSLAYLDSSFMESTPARPLRILAEYIDPLTRLQREGIADTIVMFGSARVLPYNRAQRQFERARERARQQG